MSAREYEEWRDAHTWDPSRDSELVIAGDLTPAAWIEPLLVPRSFEVRMTSPQGFEAYARIFFPFIGSEVVMDDEVRREYVTWTQLAQRNGRVAHALMEQETILAGSSADDWQTCGSLAPEQFGALLGVLTRHTSSRRGWFLHWGGFGDLNERAFEDRPVLRHPIREFYLLAGPLDSYRDFPDSPSYFWPDDRAWCLSTDVDFEWSYLAGSAACIDEVLAVPAIDALATRPDNPARSGMDLVNDPDGNTPRSG